MPALSDEDIGGLDISGQDALAVRCVKGGSDVNSHPQQPFELQRATRDDVLESLSVEKLHFDKRPAGLRPDGVNRADVGVIESGCRLSFTLEAGHRMRIAAEFGR